MMNEQTKVAQDRDDTLAHLSDMDEGIVLPAEKAPKNRRGKTIYIFLALIALGALACVCGYFLLRGGTVDLKADKRAPEKTSSGSDIRRAAYDSIRDSLTALAPAVQTPTEVAAPGAAQTNIAPTGGPDGERVSALIQQGIATTLAPPPETILAKPTPAPLINGAGDEKTRLVSPSRPPATLTTAQSVRFAPTPKPSPIGSESSKSTAGAKIADAQAAVVVANREARRLNPSIRRTDVPTFGAMLPVSLMGAVYTLRTGSFARFELTRDLKTDHWRMKRGTVFIGSVAGGDADRAYLQIKGFLDPETGRLVKVEGEVLGGDGGAGLRGKRRRITPVWARVLDRAAQAGVQIASSILNRGTSSVIVATDPYGAIRSEGQDSSRSNSKRSFVVVEAGAAGFVMVTTLTSAVEADSHLAEGAQRDREFADQELAELMTSADPARIRAALPRMSPELRQIAEMVIREIEAEGR